jgi:hypothetical protein
MKPLLHLIVFCSLAFSVWSTTPPPLTSKYLDESQLVLVAQVASVRPVPQKEDEAAFKQYAATLTPITVVKGEPVKGQITLELLIGGYVGHDPRLLEKEMYVFFLKKTEAGKFQLVHPSALAKFGQSLSL